MWGRCAACSNRSPSASPNGWRAARRPHRAARGGHRDGACSSGSWPSACSASYDLLVPDDPDESATAGNGAVYYVGANILALEKRYAFRPRDFRLWIAIHELTHRAQFTAVPWLKGYFLSLVEQALTIVDPDPGRLVQAMMRAADELRKGHNPLDDGGLVALFASPEQRGVLAQVQALMSLLEGHGNSVMNELGRVHIAGQERMARVLQARRRSRGVAGILYKLLGFESKLRQYEVGEAFVAEVVRVGGPHAIDSAWRGPEVAPDDGRARAPDGVARPRGVNIYR